jgi:hypothetical protein
MGCGRVFHPQRQGSGDQSSMDDGDLEFTDHDVFAGCSLCDLPSTPTTTGSMESFLDEMLRSTHACTHTHTCNPPGPDNTHTHTCHHTHTQLFAAGEEDSSADKSDALTSQNSKKRPLGNREAVRKYREKKKAHTAYLEEQVNHLRALNQQLVKRLQGQASLEGEVVRLRSILSEFRGRIDAEIGTFPVQAKCPTSSALATNGDCEVQPLSNGFCLNTVTVPCVTDVPCLHTAASGGARPPMTPSLEAGKWNRSNHGPDCVLSDSTVMHLN